MGSIPVGGAIIKTPALVVGVFCIRAPLFKIFSKNNGKFAKIFY